MIIPILYIAAAAIICVVGVTCAISLDNIQAREDERWERRQSIRKQAWLEIKWLGHDQESLP